MKPIPVDFHIGALQIHTYGLGLAITFYFGYRFFMKRLKDNGYSDEWLASTFIVIIAAAIIGARVFHVIANFGYYSDNPGDVFAIWHGGLSSFGGLVFAIPAGLWSARRRCPELRIGVAGDLVAPVLAAAWALGRLLGPQLMVAGGGKRTNSWVGMYYAGEVGKRLPVPIFQALECGAVFAIAIAVERYVRRHHRSTGVVASVTIGLWCLSRFFDQFFWLTKDNGTDPIEVGSLAAFVVGMAIAFWRLNQAHESDDSNGTSSSESAPIGMSASGLG